MTPLALRLILVLGLLAAATLAGWVWQRWDGRVRRTADADTRVAGGHLADVGLDLAGLEAGAILLGSPTCTPCVAVERVLTDLAATRPDFAWVKVDAADHLALVEDHRVLRVPTLLLVDGDGVLLARTSGVPDTAELAAALDGAPPREPRRQDTAA